MEAVSAKQLVGIITSFRRGPNAQNDREVLLKVENAASVGIAGTLIGSRVIYIDSHGNRFKGKIVAVHGKRGTLRARFDRGLPGQVLGKRCIIIPKTG